MRGAANLCRGLRVVGRGEPIFPREHRRSAPRAITVPNEFPKGCLRGGREPPNGSRLSCGRHASRRTAGSSCCRYSSGAQMEFYPTWVAPGSFKRLLGGKVGANRKRGL